MKEDKRQTRSEHYLEATQRLLETQSREVDALDNALAQLTDILVRLITSCLPQPSRRPEEAKGEEHKESKNNPRFF